MLRIIPLFLLTIMGVFGFDLAEHERSRTLKLAEAALSSDVRTLTAERNPNSAGDLHDFSSEGDYFWPDPANPGGPYIARDGMSNPANFTAHRQLMIAMSSQVSALASAYLLTKDERYATAAVRHLQAWFVSPETRMNPWLLYAQAVRGRSTGRRIGLIDTLHLAEPALAVLALRGSHALTREMDDAITGWFRDYLLWLRTHQFGIEESESRTNHSTCWTLQVACFARLTGDKSVLEECRQRLRNIHLTGQMGPAGNFPEELMRTKPYGYSIFHLDVLSALAMVLSTPEENLLKLQLPDGRSVLRGIEWLAPYIANKQAWLETIEFTRRGPDGPIPSGEKIKPDILYWDDWPVRQPFLLFGALTTDNAEWLSLWKRLNPDPTTEEVIRNFPIRHPLLWIPSP